MAWFTHAVRRAPLEIDEETFACVGETAPLIEASADDAVARYYRRAGRVSAPMRPRCHAGPLGADGRARDASPV